MKTIGDIKIEKRDSEVIDITLTDHDGEDITQGITKVEAISIAYYLLGVADTFEEKSNDRIEVRYPFL